MGLPLTFTLRHRLETQPRTTDFLGVEKYANVNRWADAIMERPATYRGMRVCAGAPKPWREDKGLPASPKL